MIAVVGVEIDMGFDVVWSGSVFVITPADAKSEKGPMGILQIGAWLQLARTLK